MFNGPSQLILLRYVLAKQLEAYRNNDRKGWGWMPPALEGSR